MTEAKYEVHYKDGEIYTTSYAESLKIFEAQHNGGRRCFIQPVLTSYNEP